MPKAKVSAPRLFARRHLAGHVTDAAIRLLGATLEHETPFGTLRGIIVETEAYDASEPSCHAFSGQTKTNSSLFAAAGVAYVYRSYGLHWCINVSTGARGHGAAVLIRALRPTMGIDTMFALRHKERVAPLTERSLCRGPGNLTQAMGITQEHDGAALLTKAGKLRIVLRNCPELREAISASPRIGITRATQLMWRFFFSDSVFVSGSRVKQAKALQMRR